MIEVNFNSGVDEVTVPRVTQWDYNLKLAISGLPTDSKIYQVHFFNKISSKSIVRVAYEVEEGGAYEVAIPNRLLEEPYDIKALVYLNEYERAYDVDMATKGTYYIRSGTAATGYIYTKKTLPAEYASGAVYYKQVGATVKKILIPVFPRQRPDTPIDREDASDEELVNELIGYYINLGARMDKNEARVRECEELVENYRVRTMTQAEYNALASAEGLEDGVIYAITDDDAFLQAVREYAVEHVTALRHCILKFVFSGVTTTGANINGEAVGNFYARGIPKTVEMETFAVLGQYGISSMPANGRMTVGGKEYQITAIWLSHTQYNERITFLGYSGNEESVEISVPLWDDVAVLWISEIGGRLMI